MYVQPDSAPVRGQVQKWEGLTWPCGPQKVKLELSLAQLLHFTEGRLRPEGESSFVESFNFQELGPEL